MRKLQKMDRVKLNVGGVNFETTMMTLNIMGSYFQNLCSKDSPFAKTDDIFIDRDPDLFKEILYFARTKRFRTKFCVTFLKNLCAEAIYYGYEDMRQTIMAEVKDILDFNLIDVKKDIQRVESELEFLNDKVETMVDIMSKIHSEFQSFPKGFLEKFEQRKRKK